MWKDTLFSVIALLIPPGCSEYMCTSSPKPSMSSSFCAQAVRLISAALLEQYPVLYGIATVPALEAIFSTQPLRCCRKYVRSSLMR